MVFKAGVGVTSNPRGGESVLKMIAISAGAIGGVPTITCRDWCRECKANV